MEIRENSVGYCACPICGETVDVRVNKNFKLYCICDKFHRCEFNKKESYKVRPLLSAGAVATIEKITLYPLTKRKEEAKNDEKNTGKTDKSIREIYASDSGSESSRQDGRGSEPQPTNRNIGVATTSGRSEPRERSSRNTSRRAGTGTSDDSLGFF